MTKSLSIALGMAVVLFIYGYVLSTAGHDHDSYGPVMTQEEHAVPSQ